MDSGPNAYTLLGFATVDVNHPTLTPIRNERAVLMLQKSDSAWNDVLVREPWRDCNKLYSSIRGIVLGESQCMNLEDFGITEKEIVKPKVESACTEDLSSFQHFLGGAWVGTPSVSDEEACWQIEDSTRVGIAVHDRNSWRFVVFKVGDACLNKQWDSHLVLERLIQNLDLTTADLILPFLEPKKIITPKCVVFFG